MNTHPKMHPAGFSIMEIMVVLIIISLVAGFAIPSFTKSVEKRHRQQGLQNMRTIVAAARINAERTRNFTSFCFDNTSNDAENIGEINTECNTNIVDANVAYCGNSLNPLQLHMVATDSTSGTLFVCTYTGPGNFTLTLAGCSVTATDPC